MKKMCNTWAKLTFSFTRKTLWHPLLKLLSLVVDKMTNLCCDTPE